jgi:Ca-activated chloride channel family protein
MVLVCANIAQAQRTPPVLRSSPTPVTNESPTTAERFDQDSNIRSSASLITVPAVVMDRNGRYIGNLRRDDFKIFEDGVEQKVDYFASIEEPFTVLLMLDISGSNQVQLARVRAAANTLVSRLRPNDRLMAITFDGQIHVLTEPTAVSVIRRTKLRIPPVTDGTVLYDAVDFALKRMAQVSGRKAIILFTDGVDQNSRITMKSNLADVAEQDVMIYTVQYNTLPQLPQRLSVIREEKARRKVQQMMMAKYAVSEPYLRGLADKTGGRFYRADDLADVAPAFEAITQELGVQYSLGYYPKANSTATAQRNIKIRVRYPNLVVRARDSYLTNPTIARQGGND